MRAIPGLLVRTVRKCIPTVAVVRGYEMSYVAANPIPPPLLVSWVDVRHTIFARIPYSVTQQYRLVFLFLAPPGPL